MNDKSNLDVEKVAVDLFDCAFRFVLSAFVDAIAKYSADNLNKVGDSDEALRKSFQDEKR